jgi:diadenosine tetraphosphate (Ap4A) HIT family hydrolase
MMMQAVSHVHFHVIPKPSEDVGLMMAWNEDEAEKADLQKAYEEINLRLKSGGHTD